MPQPAPAAHRTHSDRCLTPLWLAVIPWVCALVFVLTAAAPHPLEAQRRTPPQSRFTTLFDGSRTLGPVYYPATAAEGSHERRAAEALGHYLEKLSGQPWEVLPEPEAAGKRGIFVGATRRAFIDGLYPAPKPAEPLTLPTGSVQLYVTPDHVSLLGDTPQATQAGVYRFLQDYANAQWYAPGEAGEEIPALATLRLPRKLTQWQPSFRDVQYHFSGSRGQPEFRDWREKLGARHYLDFNHNLHRTFNTELHAQHPEYWAQTDGWRQAPPRGSNNKIGQLDYTNPGVAATAAAAATAAFDAQPGRYTFSLGINDSIDFGNDAATLAVVSPFEYWRGHPVFSNLVFGFANDAARQIAASHPERYLPMLAYMWAEQIPAFALEPNLLPYLCLDRAQWYDAERKRSDMELTRAWAGSGAKELGSWEYFEGSGYFVPRIFTALIAENMKFLHEESFRNIFFESSANTGFDAPKLWLSAQLAHDINADPAALLHQFYTGYYGAAAAPMQALFEYFEQIWMGQAGRTFWLKYYLDPSQAELYPPQVLRHAEALLEQAHAALEQAHAPQRYYERLKLTADSFAYLKTAATYYHIYKELVTMPLDSEADFARFDALYPEFEAARTALQEAPQLQYGTAWDLRPQMLQLHPRARLLAALRRSQFAAPTAAATATPAAPTATATGNNAFPAQAVRAVPVLREDFSEELLPDDANGFGPLPPQIRQSFRGWNIRWTHHQGALLQRIRLHQPEDEQGRPAQWVLRIENQEFLSLYRWVEIPQGASSVGVQADVLGRLGQGSSLSVSLNWLDADHKPVGKITSNMLPPGDYTGWQQLAVEGERPAGAQWAYMGVRVKQQAQGEPLYLRDWELFVW